MIEPGKLGFEFLVKVAQEITRRAFIFGPFGIQAARSVGKAVGAAKHVNPEKAVEAANLLAGFPVERAALRATQYAPKISRRLANKLLLLHYLKNIGFPIMDLLRFMVVTRSLSREFRTVRNPLVRWFWANRRSIIRRLARAGKNMGSYLISTFPRR